MALEILGLEFRDFLFNFFIPFAIVFLISYGIFERMKIFNRRINLFLALTFTTLFASTALFTFFAGFITQLGAFFAITAFLSLFILGISAQVYKRSKIIEKKPTLDMLRERYSKVLEELEEAVKKEEKIKVENLLKEKKELEEKIKVLETIMEK
ncbi:MAG: hypothetical protein QXQ18_00120 [Candidatus Aenigmatarchaeota archaeon]